ncbi:MAG: DoxX family protein [Pseudobdellovibrio sp.]
MKKYIPLIARILLGFVFFAAGITGLLNLVPVPENLPADLVTFNQGIMAAHYFMPLLKITEVFCGLLLLSGFFVPLALVILAPIVLNIFFVHAFLEPSGLPLAIILGLLTSYLSFFSAPYSPKIRALFKAR